MMTDLGLLELWGRGDLCGNTAATIVECFTSALPPDLGAHGSYDGDDLLLAIVLDDFPDAGRLFAIGQLSCGTFEAIRNEAIINADVLLDMRWKMRKFSAAPNIATIVDCGADHAGR